MKHRLLFLCVLFLIAIAAHAQGKGFGLGIILGEPTGLSGKSWLSSTTALDGGLAWSFAKGGSLHIHVDYLWHTFDALETEYSIPLYLGIGGRIKLNSGDGNHLGARFVGGFDFLLDSAPVDIFLELAPIMDLVPATQLSLNGGIGVRYFFR